VTQMDPHCTHRLTSATDLGCRTTQHLHSVRWDEHLVCARFGGCLRRGGGRDFDGAMDRPAAFAWRLAEALADAVE
jgi:hypothetical protein